MSITDHIAIAIDFSETSEVAAKAAFKLARMSKAGKVTVLHAMRRVVRPEHHEQEALLDRLSELEAKVSDRAAAALEQMCERLGAPEHTTELVAGKPADVIPQAVERIGATCLVLGTHARQGLRRMFMGSVAESVLRRLEIPALVMHVGDDGIAPDAELGDFDRCLIAVEPSPEGRHVIERGIDFVRCLGIERAQVTLLHCMEPPGLVDFATVDATATADVIEDYRAAMRAHAGKWLDARRDHVFGDATPVDVRVVEGPVVETIIAEAKTLGAEAIVIGSHGSDGASSLELGSVTEHVLRCSSVSVLVVPCNAVAP